jgi:hypothetical protein
MQLALTIRNQGIFPEVPYDTEQGKYFDEQGSLSP